MKIASLFRSMQIGVSGGAGKVHATVGKMLSAAGHSVIYVQMEDGGPRYDHVGSVVSLQEQFILGFGYKKVISWFRMAKKVAQFCTENKVDMILGQGDFFFMVVALSKLRGNKAHCTGIVHTTISIWPGFVRRILIRCLRSCDSVVCISEEEKARLEGPYGLKHVYLIHNSIDIEEIRRKSNESLLEGDEHLFSAGIYTFIAVGRFSYQKDFHLMVQLFNEFWSKHANTQLIMVGDGEEYESVVNAAARLPCARAIHFLGKRDNPFPYMKTADCFLMTSRFEGFPMVLLEACAVDLPLLSVACPTGPREIIGNNERGIVVDYPLEDCSSFLQAMEHMYTMGEQEKNDMTKKAAHYCELFDNSTIQTNWREFVEARYCKESEGS